jgi:hypothetical protein
MSPSFGKRVLLQASLLASVIGKKIPSVTQQDLDA